MVIDKPNEEGIGEIVVRGDNVTPGYRGLPKETAELIVDGWLHTGDLGRLNRGHLWITGRCKSLIVSAAMPETAPQLVRPSVAFHPVAVGARQTNKRNSRPPRLKPPHIRQLRKRPTT